jgi:hypothetical protein
MNPLFVVDLLDKSGNTLYHVGKALILPEIYLLLKNNLA